MRLSDKPYSKQVVRFVSLLLVLIFIVAMGGLPVPTVRVKAEAALRRDMWSVFGGAATVTTALQSGNILYIGGYFGYVGPPTGGFAALDAATGALDTSFPGLKSYRIQTAVPDGQGGWYVAVQICCASGFSDPERSSIYHIRADKTIDQNFTVRVDTLAIYAMKLVGNLLYVAGSFHSVNGDSRSNIAVIDVNTNTLSPISVTVNNTVYSLTAIDNTVYIGGFFTSVNGQPRANLAAVVANTGNLTTWNPGADGHVDVIVENNNRVYVGGSFSTIGGQTRSNFAVLDSTTGAATSLNIPANDRVFSFAFSNQTLYIGGSFGTLGGLLRNGVGSVDLNTNVVTAWNPSITLNGHVPYIRSLALHGGMLYIGGLFDQVGGRERVGIAAVDTTTGIVSDWKQDLFSTNSSPSVSTLHIIGNTIYAGGDFQSMGGVHRSNLAAIDLTTGKATSWQPSTNGNYWYVQAMEIRGNTLYIGGTFRGMLAAIDLTTGQRLDWNPDVQSYATFYQLYTMVIHENTLYFGGLFDSVNGQPRRNLAGVDLSTGAVTNFNPTIGPSNYGSITSLAMQGSTLYIAGNFSSVGSLGRAQLAAIDVYTSQPTAWNPSANSGISYFKKLVVHNNLVYVAGQFSWIGGAVRSNLAAVDTVSGSATAWNPQFPQTAASLAITGNTVYVMSFDHNYGIARLSAFGTTTGLATDWRATASVDGQYPPALSVGASGVFLYGDIFTLNRYYAPGIALIRDTNPVPTSTPTATQSGTPRPPRVDTVGVYKNGTFYLRHSNTTGGADLTAAFGGAPSDLPVTGDWNGDGMDTIGVYRSATGFFYLSNTNAAPSVAHTLLFGNPGDSPFAGRWTPDMMHDGIGVYRNSNGILYQKKALATGVDDYFAVFGNPGDIAVAGDWNGDGFDSIGVYRSNTWYLSNNSTPAGITFADMSLNWFIGSNAPFAGDWDGDGINTPGSLSSTGQFTLRSTLAASSTTTVFAFGPADARPLAGKWTLPAQPPPYAVLRPPLSGANPSGDGTGD